MSLTSSDILSDEVCVEQLKLSSNALFIEDVGELPLDTRRVLIKLLTGPFIDGRHHSKLWPILLRDEIIIRSRLADVFLELVLDRDLQVAFTRQADTGELEVPRLLRSTPLTFLNSALLLYLRQRLTQADSQGERAVVSHDEIREYLTLYERSHNTDRVSFFNSVQASIEKMKKYNIIQKIKGSDDRFEISPTLKLLFSAEEIQSIKKLYQTMAEGKTIGKDAVNAVDEDII